MSRSTQPLSLAGVIGDVLDAFVPTIKMRVVYNTDMEVKNGFEFLPSTITSPPLVELLGGEFGSFFTLIMTDPDAPNPSDPTGREYLHWIVTDIPGTKSSLFGKHGNQVLSKDVPKYVGREMVDYERPNPMVGIHRYVLTLFRQTGKGKVDPPNSRRRFKTRDFAGRNGLGLPVAAVYFNVQRETAARRR